MAALEATHDGGGVVVWFQRPFFSLSFPQDSSQPCQVLKVSCFFIFVSNLILNTLIVICLALNYFFI